MSLRSFVPSGGRLDALWLLIPALRVGAFASAVIVILSDTGAVARPAQRAESGAGSGGAASPVPSASEVFANRPAAEVPAHIDAF